MSPPIVSNTVTFRPNVAEGETAQRVYLKLSGRWTRRAGLVPDVNLAACSEDEYAKLPADKSNLSGKIEFWSRSEPGDQIDPVTGEVFVPTEGFTPGLLEATPEEELDVWLVDPDPEEIGSTYDNPLDRAIAMKLAFADWRHGILEPRGGRVMAYRLNPEPPLPGDVLVTNSELAAMLETALGVPMTIPGTMDEVPPQMELDYNVAPASSCLRSLLEHTSHIACPTNEGIGLHLVPIGIGAIPTIPANRHCRTLTFDVVDRRAQAVVFTSASRGATRTYNEVMTTPPAWRYVVQDPADSDRWKSIDDIDELQAGEGPLENFKSELRDTSIPEEDRPRVLQQMYRCIQLDPAKFPGRKVAVLRDVFFPDMTVAQPSIRVRHGVRTRSGAWKNKTTRMQASKVHANDNVLEFPNLLLRVGVAENASKPDILSDGVELAASSLKPTYSVEGFDTDNDRRELAVLGYILIGGSVNAMTTAAAEGYLQGFNPTVEIRSTAELHLITLNNAANNKSALNDRCMAYATAMLRDINTTRKVIEVEGFFACSLNGRVSQIDFDQVERKTYIEIDGHTRPRPGQGKAIDRTFAGTSARYDKVTIAEGRAGRTTPIAPTGQERGETGLRPGLVKLTTPIDEEMGRWNAKRFSLDINTAATSGLAEADLGTLSSVDDCIVIVPQEIGGVRTFTGGEIVSVRYGAMKDDTTTPLAVLTGGAGGTLPPGTFKHAVLSLMDDDLNVGWDHVRVPAIGDLGGG